MLTKSQLTAARFSCQISEQVDIICVICPVLTRTRIIATANDKEGVKDRVLLLRRFTGGCQATFRCIPLTSGQECGSETPCYIFLLNPILSKNLEMALSPTSSKLFCRISISF